MRSLGMAGVLILAMAWVQVKTNTAAPAGHPSVSSATDKPESSGQEEAPAAIASDAAVITIKGLCPERASNLAIKSASAGCETVITRAQFEKLTDVLHMSKGSQTWHQLGTSYPQVLIMAKEAEKRGVDKQPRFQEILSQELIRELREEADRVPEKDIADYYRQHTGEFEQVSLERIVIPSRAQRDLAANGQADKPEDAMAKEAELLRTRAAQGEDFAKLQKEGYDFAGLSGDSDPTPKLDKLRRRGLPLTQASAFNLKVGQVSPVISDATGYYIYKLDGREIAPLESVKVEIAGTLRQQRLRDVVQAIQQPFTTDINQKYFGAAKDDD
jgi:parvulin-like peptidyl-prolyl isomerase